MNDMEMKEPRERQTPANNVLLGMLTILGALSGILVLLLVIAIGIIHNI